MSRVIGWERLQFTCVACNEPNADIRFTFKDRLGTKTECYHDKCTPTELMRFYNHTHDSMVEFAKTPIGG